jgi:hypothetical protein
MGRIIGENRVGVGRGRGNKVGREADLKEEKVVDWSKKGHYIIYSDLIRR